MNFNGIYFEMLKNTDDQDHKSDIQVVNVERVSCDGGELGHPKIFLSLLPNKEVLCPYCSKKFINKKSK